MGGRSCFITSGAFVDTLNWTAPERSRATSGCRGHSAAPPAAPPPPALARAPPLVVWPAARAAGVTGSCLPAYAGTLPGHLAHLLHPAARIQELTNRAILRAWT